MNSLIDATPKKKLFLSIIADYTFKTAMCELIDNAIDNYKNEKLNENLKINLFFNLDSQKIIMKDNAGGVSEENIGNLVSPGASGNDSEKNLIGIFGVGTKRAVVHLSKDILIKTRYKKKNTFQIHINEDWINDDNTWDLEKTKIEDIGESETIIELKDLRSKLDVEKIKNLVSHLGITYLNFLKYESVEIKISYIKNEEDNELKIFPTNLENWSYNVKYKPKTYIVDIPYKTKKIKIKIRVGLSNKYSPEGNYGFYFFCNNRLISYNCKDEELGYVTGIIGKPHNTISIVKIFVFITGPSEAMPWNSNKTKINYEHIVFRKLKPHLSKLAKVWSSAARSITGRFKQEFSIYDKGKVEDEIRLEDISKINDIGKPEIPNMKKTYEKKILKANEKIINESPWTRGLNESMIFVENILKKNYVTKNRIALILLERTFED